MPGTLLSASLGAPLLGSLLTFSGATELRVQGSLPRPSWPAAARPIFSARFRGSLRDALGGLGQPTQLARPATPAGLWLREWRWEEGVCCDLRCACTTRT